MNTIVFAVVSVSSLGLICGSILAIASKFMYVKIDERITALAAVLPGANCGACGFPGCSGYAEAIIVDGAAPNRCSPGGAATLAKISAILGGEAGAIDRKAAVVHCRGDCDAQQKKMDYKGIESCVAAKQLFGGEGACAFGCLGYGDCKAVCPSNAICIENGLAWVDPRLCTGCGLCVKTCPNSLISLENDSIKVAVLCKNLEKGAVVRKKCTRGCIACGKCVRTCLSQAIVIEDSLAKIDYSKCSRCGGCAAECVTKSIQLANLGAAKQTAG